MDSPTISCEEEGIALGILPLSLRQVLVWRVLCPCACRKDVLVAFIPPPVYDFGDGWVVTEAFELLIWHRWLFAFVDRRWIERIVDSWLQISICCLSDWCCPRGLCRVIEHEAVEPSYSVKEKVINLVVL